MSYQIIADSCCELTEEMKRDQGVLTASLTLEVGEEQIIDDETSEVFSGKSGGVSGMPEICVPFPGGISTGV